MPGKSIEESWKVSDLPAPVGRIASVSVPASTRLTTATSTGGASGASTAIPATASTASSARSPARGRDRVRPGAPRGDGRASWPAPTPSSPARSASASPTSGPGAIHLLNGLYDAQARPPAGGRASSASSRARRSAQLPAGGRPPRAVQGRRPRIRAAWRPRRRRCATWSTAPCASRSPSARRPA